MILAEGDLADCVSVLFSEPKIPQSCIAIASLSVPNRFSALQRAENSSIRRCSGRSIRVSKVSVLFSEPKIPQSRIQAINPATVTRFQCSSASRKFLNLCAVSRCGGMISVSVLFSEPKIPQSVWRTSAAARKSPFQCSSASRKFLNRCEQHQKDARGARFSALQRAENSSIPARFASPISC